MVLLFFHLNVKDIYERKGKSSVSLFSVILCIGFLFALEIMAQNVEYF